MGDLPILGNLPKGRGVNQEERRRKRSGKEKDSPADTASRPGGKFRHSRVRKFQMGSGD